MAFAKRLLWNRDRREGRESLTEDGVVEAGEPAQILASLTRTERNAIVGEVAEQTLDEREQAAFLLKYVEGMTLAAGVAEHLGLDGPLAAKRLLKGCRDRVEVRLREELRLRGHGELVLADDVVTVHTVRRCPRVRRGSDAQRT